LIELHKFIPDYVRQHNNRRKFRKCRRVHFWQNYNEWGFQTVKISTTQNRSVTDGQTDRQTNILRQHTSR